MVHALEEIRRMLSPGGVLIDIHPLCEAARIGVYAGKQVIFTVPDPEYAGEGCLQANAAIDQVLRDGLFTLERSMQFDFIVYGSSAYELRKYVEEAEAFDETPPDEAVQARLANLYGRIDREIHEVGDAAEAIYHEKVIITRLEPVRQIDMGC